MLSHPHSWEDKAPAGRRKGMVWGEQGRFSQKGTKHCHEKLEFPRAAEPGRAPSKASTGDALKPRLSQRLGRPWHELGASSPWPGLASSSWWGGGCGHCGVSSWSLPSACSLPRVQGCAGSTGLGQDQHGVPRLKMCCHDRCVSRQKALRCWHSPPGPPHKPQEASAERAVSTVPPCPIPTCSHLSRV